MPNPFARVAESIAPARLGRSFRWLLASALVNNVGDGVALAAGPLLVASQTRDPLLVSLAVLAQNLPVLLFGFAAGVVADRVDRSAVMAAVNLGRAAGARRARGTIVTGRVSIALVLVALFVLGHRGDVRRRRRPEPPAPTRAPRGPGHRERTDHRAPSC